MPSEQSLLHTVWSTLRNCLVGCGLSGPLLHIGYLGLDETRRHLSLRYLKPEGTALGLEIGAMHRPLPLPVGARALYIDKYTRRALQEMSSEVTTSIVTPDIITDGFNLGCIAPSSQDFLIANHVLEHASNALGTLQNWLRVLRPGGILFVAVPRGDRCFDRGRTITSVAHFVEDHRLSIAGDHATIRARNREHIEEHLSISAPVLARQQGQIWTAPKPEAREQLIERLLGSDSSLVHHHVFTPASFGALLGLLNTSMVVERIAHSSVEIIGIARKRV